MLARNKMFLIFSSDDNLASDNTCPASFFHNALSIRRHSSANNPAFKTTR